MSLLLCAVLQYTTVLYCSALSYIELHVGRLHLQPLRIQHLEEQAVQLLKGPLTLCTHPTQAQNSTALYCTALMGHKCST